MDSASKRQPLRELNENTQSEKPQAPASSLKKAGVSRTSLITKHSSIPKPTRSSRLPVIRQKGKIETGQDLPPPSRMSAKPRRTANAPFRKTSRAPLQSDPSRRSAAAMNFTHSASSTRTGLSGRRGSQFQDISSAAQGSHQGFDISSLPQAIGEALKEVMKPKLDEDRRAEVEDIVKQQMSISNENASNIAAEALKLKSDIFNLQVRLKEAERIANEEKDRANKEGSKASDLQSELMTLKQISTEKVDPAEIETLRNQLRESQARTNDCERRITSLGTELRSARESAAEHENHVNNLSGQLRDTRLRAERIETDLSCRESEIRRVKREKDELQCERQDLLETVKKRGACVEEEQGKSEKLRRELERNKEETEKVVKNLQARLHAYDAEMQPKLASLEQENAELRNSLDKSLCDVEHRRKELDTCKEKTSLLESKVTHLTNERTNFEMKIETLNESHANASKQICRLAEDISKQKEEIDALEQQAREDAAIRRRLHNTIQELKGNIRVFARVRPLLEAEMPDITPSPVHEMFDYTERGQGITAMTPKVDENGSIVPVKRSRYPFKFDRVFDPTSSQEVVFEEISQLVQSALDGYRVCVFAYGQTGSGKTYTMLGTRDGDVNNLGMIPRSVRQVFDTAKAMEKDGWSFRLKASFLEIYNEVIRDLLTDSKSSMATKGKDSRTRDDQYKIIFSHETRLSTVQDLTIEDVKDERQLHHLIDMSMKRRATAATKANERSSRSHSLFRLYIEGSNSQTGEKRNGLLNLIDLAGSERLGHSKAEGDRLRETKNINRSLSALGDVIAALGNKDKHVPFRNSKLTHVLQDSLGGDSKTLMFVNISHAPESFHESLTSLRFAAKVNNCHLGTAKRSARVEL